MSGCGVDLRRQGLPCRADQGVCRFVVRAVIDDVVGIAAAAALRDAHEQLEHGYAHVIRPVWGARFGTEIRSDVARAAAQTRWKRKAMPNVGA